MTSFSFYATLVFFIVLCVFFALLILIQKGRGGGISAAFGGAGGNTAFGSKTGDVLTWATSVVFLIFLISAVVLNLLADRVNRAFVEGETAVVAPGGETTGGAPLATPDAGTPTAPLATPDAGTPTIPPITDQPATPPATGPASSVIPPQNRTPGGIVEPAVERPTTAPSAQP